jgi:tRNA A37 methylthiotransferase MiaB
MKQVDKTVALSRSAKLREVASELKRKFLLSQSGKEVEVFIEEMEGEYGVGHTSNFIKVYTSCAPGEFVKQKITVPFKDGVKGENI